MSWSGSAVFTQFLWNPGIKTLRGSGVSVPTSFVDIATDTIKAALFDNTVTPNKDATSTAAAYGGGVWASGEVTGGANWNTGGRQIDDSAAGLSTGTGFIMYDAADTAGGGTVTISNARGCLVYDDSTTGSPVDLGICYNDFGSDQSVTSGTFTIVWHANGIFRITV